MRQRVYVLEVRSSKIPGASSLRRWYRAGVFDTQRDARREAETYPTISWECRMTVYVRGSFKKAGPT